VAKILLENIVQGKNIGDDRYSKYSSVVERHGRIRILTTSLELRIHEHTERGDNDTIKMPNGKKVVIDGKKCSD
jgi:complex III assembly factor LYRM7